jgi:hypothetical protein
MIVPLKSGGQLIISECLWVPGAYLACGNMPGSQGIIMKPAELDQAIAELTRIRDAIGERAAAKQQKRSKAA